MDLFILGRGYTETTLRRGNIIIILRERDDNHFKLMVSYGWKTVVGYILMDDNISMDDYVEHAQELLTGEDYDNTDDLDWIFSDIHYRLTFE